MKFFVSHLLQHFVPDSLIWLHDGIWISPLPPHDLIVTANRLATAQSRFSEDPLLLSCTSLKPSYQDVLSRTLSGMPPPPLDPLVLFRPPRQLLVPPLAETDAKRAFVRMMARQATIPLASVASIIGSSGHSCSWVPLVVRGGYNAFHVRHHLVYSMRSSPYSATTDHFSAEQFESQKKSRHEGPSHSSYSLAAFAVFALTTSAAGSLSVLQE